VLSVAIGAFAAVGLIRLSPPAAIYSLAILVAVADAGGTHGSRWSVGPGVHHLPGLPDPPLLPPHEACARYGERVLETLLGVGLAYLFGLGLPALALRDRRRGQHS
jgi:hypothetical protein